MDYTLLTPGPANGCPRCHLLWQQADSKKVADHLLEHYPKVKKRYAFTFTTNGNDVMKEQSSLCYAVDKLFYQQTVPIQEGEAWLEYTETGRPHIHGWYSTVDGGRVFAKTFARCWHLWKERRGMKEFPGGYHSEMKTDRYLGYASAEGRRYAKKEKDTSVVLDNTVAQMRPASGILFIET